MKDCSTPFPKPFVELLEPAIPKNHRVLSELTDIPQKTIVSKEVSLPKRRKFNPEFKHGAVEQACQPSVCCAQMASDLPAPDKLTVNVS